MVAGLSRDRGTVPLPYPRSGVPNLTHCDMPSSTNALGRTQSYPLMHVAHRLQVRCTQLSVPLGKLGCAVSTEQNQEQAVLLLSREPVTDADLAFLK